MRLQDTCLALCTWIDELQQIEPQYVEYGPAYNPDFKSGLSGRLFSVMYTRGGRLEAPSAQVLNPAALRTRFMNALENRTCRVNYQRTINRLENILDDAQTRFDFDQIADRLGRRDVVTALRGGQFYEQLRAAGMTFREPYRFQYLAGKAQECGQAHWAAPAPQAPQV
jgi:hypothetical protein